ncbi:MAG: Toluene efflux pump outer membrane protein TtgI [Chlamydiales bacterium]|nr:Toluene efflux pump outer membrane protein TtgI [Chlamydiales bacterium]
MKQWLFCSLLLLVGCRPCLQPNIEMPTYYVEERATSGEEANLSFWWEQFEDPQLSCLIEKALLSNYDLRIARERICEARAVYGIEFSVLLPQVDAFGTIQRMRNSLTLAEAPFLGGKFVNFYQAGFDSIWELDVFGKNQDRARAAAYDVAMTREEVRNVHITIASEVALHYFAIRTLQKRLEIAYKHIDTELQLVEITSDRYQSGIISALDVYQAKALLETRYAVVPLLQTLFYQEIYALAVVLGELPEAYVDVFCESQDLPFSKERIPLGFPSELLCNRPDIRANEYAMRAAGARVMAARKEIFPTLSLQSLYSYATGFFTRLPEAGSKQWTGFPGLRLPLFHGGEIISNIKAETSVQRQAVLAYEQSVLIALQEVESFLVEYFKESARIEALEAEVKAYQEVRAIALIQYEGGLLDFLNVIEAERDLFIAENLLAESQEHLLSSLVSVYKALGGGWECSD